MTLTEWDNLPDYERRDRLAFDYWRQDMIQSLLDGLIKSGTTSDGRILVDWSAYVALQLGKLNT